MNRAEVLKLCQEITEMKEKLGRYHPDTVAEIIDCYESLLSRCKPWLEIMREAAENAKLGKGKAEGLAKLDALLRELEESDELL